MTGGQGDGDIKEYGREAELALHPRRAYRRPRLEGILELLEEVAREPRASGRRVPAGDVGQLVAATPEVRPSALGQEPFGDRDGGVPSSSMTRGS